MTLVEALKKFNRKERYWLIRNALGDNSEILHLDLDPGFLELLEEMLLDVKVPENAWWAVDYHIDWLAGAFHLFNWQGKENLSEKPVDNQKLFHASIQDIDLIVAFDNTLIFIEAKGDSDWNYTQINTKIDRLQEIAKAEYIEGLKAYFILMAPEDLVNILDKDKIHATLPDGIFAGDKPRLLKLKILDENNKEVTNFDDFFRLERRKVGKPCKTGEFFLVKNPQKSKSDLLIKTTCQ